MYNYIPFFQGEEKERAIWNSTSAQRMRKQISRQTRREKYLKEKERLKDPVIRKQVRQRRAAQYIQYKNEKLKSVKK